MKIKFIILISILVLGAFSAQAGDRALVVGVDFYVSVAETPGATADAKAMQRLLVDKFNFDPGSIKILLNEEATAANIVRNFRSWLIDGTRPGDRVFFFYAGHGFQTDDDNGDELDGKDEVITPYDVKIVQQGGKILLPDERTFIRDDQFNDFIAQLSGRRAVLMFDSCHSGTLSRSLGGKKREGSRYLTPKPTRSRSIGDKGYSEVPKDQKKRDLTTITESGLQDNINGIVLLSAASAYQQAFPVELGGGELRGAFSYIFEELIRRNENIRIEDLEGALKQQMQILAEKKVIEPSRNGEYQVPQVEIVSKVDLAGKPLFAGSTSADSFAESLKYALFNPLSDLKVRLNLSKSSYRLGDSITYTVDVSETSYLYILVFSTQNQAFCIFPTEIGSDTVNRVAAGRHNFPRGDYVTEATEPVGRDIWVALASRQKLRIGEKQDYTWDEMFNRIGLTKLQAAIAKKVASMRGAGNKRVTTITDDDWQADVVIVETRR
jgi:hypothetical protein